MKFQVIRRSGKSFSECLDSTIQAVRTWQSRQAQRGKIIPEVMIFDKATPMLTIRMDGAIEEIMPRPVRVSLLDQLADRAVQMKHVKGKWTPRYPAAVGMSRLILNMGKLD